jgi:hypothetical protein
MFAGDRKSSTSFFEDLRNESAALRTGSEDFAGICVFHQRQGLLMSNEKAHEAAKPDAKDAGKPKSTEPKTPAGLSDEELEQVSAGINPQPIPPGLRQ